MTRLCCPGRIRLFLRAEILPPTLVWLSIISTSASFGSWTSLKGHWSFFIQTTDTTSTMISKGINTEKRYFTDDLQEPAARNEQTCPLKRLRQLERMVFQVLEIERNKIRTLSRFSGGRSDCKRNSQVFFFYKFVGGNSL